MMAWEEQVSLAKIITGLAKELLVPFQKMGYQPQPWNYQKRWKGDSIEDAENRQSTENHRGQERRGLVLRLAAAC
jgi:hypothetical protein